MANDPLRDQILRQFRERWSETRLKGRWRFIAINGLLVWGGMMAAGIVAGRIIFSGHLESGSAILITLFCLAGGCVIGQKMWDENERQFSAGQKALVGSEARSPRPSD